MEIEKHQQQKPLFRGIVYNCDSQVQMCFLQFLQTEVILNIALLAKKYKKEEYFYKLALVLSYFKVYLNRVDRSMYYLFYEEKQFATLEQSFIINIAKNTDKIFFEFRNQQQQFFNKFYQLTNFVQQQEQLKMLMENIFFQTDYPLPACKRQTIGVFCQTPFQQFMALIRFPTIQGPQDFNEPPLIMMRKYFLEGTDMKKTVQLIYENGPQSISKISILRYCPYVVRNMNYDQIRIQNFEIHNIIVVLYKLISINAQASRIIIQEQQDPIMKMAEFVTRANIFKNIVLGVEEKFGFLFQSYRDIFQIITKGQYSSSLPKFQFWNGAMTIWVQQCQQLQSQLYQSFNYIMLKQRQQNLKTFLKQKSQSFPSVYNSLTLEIQQNSIFQTIKSSTYPNGGELYESFFQANVDSLEVLGKDFLEHQIDISINEFNVHKCGHSEHVIKRISFFNDFIQSVKNASNSFYKHIQNLVFKKINDTHLKLGTLKDLIKSDLQFIDGKFTKPVILKEVLSGAQQMIRTIVNKMPQFAVFPEEAMDKFNLYLDFSHKDNLLDYFCSKSQTPNDCKPQLRNFYDVYKDKSIEQILNLAMSIKGDSQFIYSQIEEEFYESSLSNSSMISLQEL